MVTVDRRLWLTADRKRVVEDSDEAAAFLFASPGDEITDEEAARYGLGPKPTPAPEPKAADKPADKARTPRGNK